MKLKNREEFERRLLALVRDYFDDADENEVFEDGYDVSEVIVIFNIVEPPPSDEPLDAWHGGPHQGWRSWVGWTSTLHPDWMKKAMLEQALHLLNRPAEPDAPDDSEDNEDTRE